MVELRSHVRVNSSCVSLGRANGGIGGDGRLDWAYWLRPNKIILKLVSSEASVRSEKFCVSDFCEDGFAYSYIANEASTAQSSSLLGRIERSSPNAAPRRVEGAGLDGNGADQAIIDDVVMSIVFIIALLLENGRRIGWRTGL